MFDELVKTGFDVTIIDISKSVITAIKEEAQNNDVNINTIVADLDNYEVKDKYGIIITTGILHFIKKDIIHDFIDKIQANTMRVN